ncbi:hypothetical protein GEMRC1_006884 [Eukaryota sp. GEM-RC1]
MSRYRRQTSNHIAPPSKRRGNSTSSADLPLLDLHPFLSDKDSAVSLKISPSDLSDLFSSYCEEHNLESRETWIVTKSIVRTIQSSTNNVSFPYKSLYTPQEAILAKCKSLLDFRPPQLATEEYGPSGNEKVFGFTHFHSSLFSYRFKDSYAAIPSTPNDYDVDVISDYANEEVRLEARVAKNTDTNTFYPTVPEAFFKNENFLFNAINSITPLKTGIDPESLRDAMWKFSRKGPHCREATSFFPSKVKGLLKTVFPNTKRVLDPCSGWGDRLLGSMASNVKHYVGVDPNSKLFPGYRKLEDWMKQVGSKTTVDMFNSPFESVDLAGFENYFDLVFTGPPFFTFEVYTEEVGQSVEAKTSCDEWIAGWLFPMVVKSLEYLKKDGHLALYIADLFKPYIFVEPLCLFIEIFCQCQFKGCVSFVSGRNAYRPIWVWQKTGKQNPTRVEEAKRVFAQNYPELWTLVNKLRNEVSN